MDEVERSLLAVEREIVVMKLIDHPNILKLYDVWETSSSLYLVLEYVQGGELFDYLCNEGRRPTHEGLDYFQQIISAVDYCHRFNIAHRDLKLENILIDDKSNIKIADFGMAAWQDSSRGNLLRTSCGSPHYAAPEVISGKPYDGRAADIWSCGIILYALLAAKLPFDDDDCPTLLQKIANGKFDMPTDIDPQAQNLISRMLTTNVAERITMPEIIRHPFFLSRPLKNSDALVSNLNLDLSAKPIVSRSAIDPDIFANLRTLWHGTVDTDLMEALLNSERNWEKGIYHLLCVYREKYLESRREEEGLIRSRKQQKTTRQLTGIPTLKSTLPPRAGPPTPRRARGHGQPAPHSEMTFVHVEKPGQSAPLISLSRTLPNHKTSEVDFDDTNLSIVAAPELEDEKIQAFFRQVANHLNVLQARAVSLHSPKIGQSPPILKLPEMPSATLLSCRLGARAMNREDPFDEYPLGQSSTRPLTVRRKGAPLTKCHSGEKENTMHFTESVLNRSSPLLQHAFKMADNRGIQTLRTPLNHKPSKPKKDGLMLPNPPISPNFSEGGSSSMASSPKSPNTPKRWLDNVFKFKTATYTLLSLHDIHTTRSECRRLLIEMDLLVSLEESEKLGLLKCRSIDTKEVNNMTQGVKSLKFRVEMRWPTPQHCQEGYMVSLHLIQEKGSLEAFRGIYQQLARNWTLGTKKADD